jgi:hypothetical protein
MWAYNTASFEGRIRSTRMWPAKWILGCSIILLSAGGMIISTHYVNAMIPPKTFRHAARPDASPDISTAGRRVDDTGGEASMPSGRICTDSNGKPFVWNWPNTPFGATACRDAAESKPN